MISKKKLKSFENAIKSWRNPDSSSDCLEKVYAADRKQLRMVLRYIKAGQNKAAFELANSLDTIVRDQIPQDVYEEIYR